MPERCLVAAALAHWRQAIEPRHLGVYPGLVEEDQALRVEERLRRSPQLASSGDVRSVLLGRARGFFLNDSPRRLAAFQIAPVLSATSCSANSQA
jgi:hypothetical protein